MNKNVLFVSAGNHTIFYENWLDEERKYEYRRFYKIIS